MIALGQFRDTFIIAVDEEGIAIIDQHVAHERVLFERIIERLTRRPPGEPAAARADADRAAGGRAAGACGPRAPSSSASDSSSRSSAGNAIRLVSVPALLRREECDAAIRALAEDLEGLDRGSGVDAALKRTAATMACHAAVKANYPLTAEKMAHILDELRRTAYSTICPHGRPVMLRLTRREVEKNFQRI